MQGQIQPHLLPTGCNSEFKFGAISFIQSIEQMRSLVAKCHVHQAQFDQATVIEANLPFDWPQSKASRGIVLVHGLTASAFQLRELGLILHAQGFWVRAITLPGHGTVPGDLLQVKLNAWQAALRHAVDDLAAKVNEVFIGGYSLGGALALDLAVTMPSIKGLILFAPALRLKRYIEIGIRAKTFLQKFWRQSPWLQCLAEFDYAKYNSLPVNAVFQLQLLIDSLSERLACQQVEIPIFTVLSQADELINNHYVLNLQQRLVHPCSHVLLYSSVKQKSKQNRLTLRSSHFPLQRILDFSHTALATSPGCPHYGQNGDHVPEICSPGSQGDAETYLGARQRRAKNIRLQRLTYNPDFKGMVEILTEWLAKI